VLLVWICDHGIHKRIQHCNSCNHILQRLEDGFYDHPYDPPWVEVQHFNLILLQEAHQWTRVRGIKVGTWRFFCPSQSRSNLIQLDSCPTGLPNSENMCSWNAIWCRKIVKGC
jgi:hypothetical protein